MQCVKEAGFLRPDLPCDEPRLLRSLLGFDLLASLLGSVDSEGFQAEQLCPNFIYWEFSKVEPLLTLLLGDENMRNQLFSVEVPEQFLAKALRNLEQLGMTGASTRWKAKTVTCFLNKYSGS